MTENENAAVSAEETASIAETAVTETVETAAEAPAATEETVIAAEGAAAEAEALNQTQTETAADDSAQQAAAQNTLLGTGGLFSLIMFAMAVYVIIGGIRGEGKLFQIGAVKKGKEAQAKKTLRIVYIAMGSCMALNTAGSFLRDKIFTYSTEAGDFVRNPDVLPWLNISYKALNVFAIVMMIVTMIGVVIMFIAVSRFTDKEAQRKQEAEKQAQRSKGGSTGSIFPSGAFDFDETDEETRPEEISAAEESGAGDAQPEETKED